MNLKGKELHFQKLTQIIFGVQKKKQNTEDKEDPDLWGCNLGSGCNLGPHTYSPCPQ